LRAHVWERLHQKREILTSARHRLWIFEGPVIILIASAFRGSRVGRHAVVWTSLALVVATAVLIFARRTHYKTRKIKNKTIKISSLKGLFKAHQNVLFPPSSSRRKKMVEIWRMKQEKKRVEANEKG
jgi:hypothetical protein